MGLTPMDILNKEFSKKFRGYDDEEVNDFLDIVVAEYEKLIANNALLQQQVSENQDKLRYFEQLQDSLNSSILVANEAAERLKQNARKEAELILYEADIEKDKIIKDAREEASRLTAANEGMRKEAQQLRESIKQMVQAQLDALESGDFVQHFSHSAQVNEATAVVNSGVSDVTEPVSGYEEELQAVSEAYIPGEIEASSVTTFETEEVPVSESVLGQTIRIELPRD